MYWPKSFSLAMLTSVLLLLFSPSGQAQKPLFVTQTPITGNSGNSFFIFLPMENAGSGEATNIQLRSASLTYLGIPASTVTQPPNMPSLIGFAAPTGVHVLDLEFDNSHLIAGNRYMLIVNGSFEASGVVYGFQLNRPVIYAKGFSTTEDQVLSAIDSKFDSLPGVDPVADDQILLAFLKGLPQVSGAGSQVDPPLVWVQFVDGSRIDILNNIKLPQTLVLHSVKAQNLASGNQNNLATPLVTEAPTAAPQASPGPTELPSVKQIRVLNEMDSGFEEAASDVQRWLEGNGYKQVSNADGSLAGLRAVGGDGVLYINSHGGIDKAEGFNSFFIVTSTAEIPYCDPASKNFGKIPCPDKFLPDDIANKRVIRTKARNHLDPLTNKFVSHGNFAINKNFVDKYWGAFANNALVYIDACHSDQDDPNVQAFKDVIFLKKNASVYAGWSNTVGTTASADTARLVFDRLLGANQFCPEDGATECSSGPAVPPVFAQRPFEYTQAAIDLPKHGLGSDTGPAAVLKFEPNPQGSGFGLLAPSIAQMLAIETGISGPQPQLLMSGLFGTDPGSDGTVTVGGVPAKIADWTNNIITANLPSGTGPGSAGDVVVTVRQHKSNTARLTQWQGPFNYNITGPGSLAQKVTFNPAFRGDVRQFRPVIHDPPFEPTVPAIEAIIPGSNASFACSGTDMLFPGEAGILSETFTWNGSGTPPPFDLSSVRFAPPPDVYFSIVGQMIRSHTVLNMQFGLKARSVCTDMEHFVFVSPPGGVFDQTVPLDIFFSVQNFDINLDDQAVIKNDQLTFPNLPCNVPPPYLCTATLQWNSIQPVENTEPDPNSPR